MELRLSLIPSRDDPTRGERIGAVLPVTTSRILVETTIGVTVQEFCRARPFPVAINPASMVSFMNALFE